MEEAFEHPVFTWFILHTNDFGCEDDTRNPSIGQGIKQASFGPDLTKLAHIEAQLRDAFAQKDIPVRLPLAVHLIRSGG